jgi:hypothetical protein
MRTIVGAALLCASFVWAQPAGAQDARPAGMFAEGVVFAGLEFRSHTLFGGTEVVEAGVNPSDQVLGGGFAIGTFLGPQVSVRAEVALLSETALHTEGSIGDVQTSIVDRYISGQTFSVLAGYHPRSSGRVRLAYLGGVAFVRLTEEFIQQLRRDGLPGIPAVVDVIEGRQVVYGPTAMVGMDAAIRVASHLDLVPQVRVTAADGLSFRPGISVRWRR